jgi:4-hydroxybenzoate polyprenyltransferase
MRVKRPAPRAAHMTTLTTDSTVPDSKTVVAKLSLFAADIKISHTIFALPWAILASFLAAKETAHPITAIKLLLIIICMVSARTLAMAANRLLDAGLDAQNPRTARRAIPSGALSKTFVTGITVVCVVAFVVACFGFYYFYNNHWPLLLALPVLAFLSAYPLLKRFTRLCHYYLGAALALAPLCAWLAIAGQVAGAPLLMAAAVLCWTAGFDIIYACQDYVSDCATGVFSVPAKLGIAKALWVARLTHLVCAVLLVTLGYVSPTLSIFYFVGVAFAIGLLIVEHLLVKPNDLSKVGLAFFTVNGIISLLVGTLGIIDVLRAH